MNRGDPQGSQMPETMRNLRASTPYPTTPVQRVGRGVVLLVLAWQPAVFAADGATEALELRLHAERAIRQERATGHAPLADAMRGMLPGLLTEYLASRDETIALDVVDSAFVREQVKLGEMMQDPGSAWALDVFAGPGTGHEHGVRSSLANLADFHDKRSERAMEQVVDVYERNVSKQMERLEKAQEHQERIQDQHMEAQLVHAADRVNKVFERVEAKTEHIAEKAVEKVEKAAEKAAEKAEDKAAKDAEKADKEAEKEADKQADKDPDPIPAPAQAGDGGKDKGGKKG